MIKESVLQFPFKKQNVADINSTLTGDAASLLTDQENKWYTQAMNVNRLLNAGIAGYSRLSEAINVNNCG